MCRSQRQSTQTMGALLSLVLLSTVAINVQAQQEHPWQRLPGHALPRLLATEAKQPQEAAAPAADAAVKPDAETDAQVVSAARQPSPPTKTVDFIDRLRSAPDEPEAPPPPPAPAPRTKKQAAGVRGNPYVDQLLGTMKRPPPRPRSPAPKTQQQGRRTPAPAVKPRATKAAPAAAPAAPPRQPTPAESPADDFVCPPGIICAQRGSKICGSAICGPDEKCVEGFMCCAKEAPLCNGRCCPGGHTCMAGRCSPPGSKSCGDNVCFPGTECYNTATNAPVGANTTNTSTPTAAIGVLVCCSSKELLCGASCCRQGETCLAGQCRAPGSTVCGVSNVCPPGQQCIGNTTCCLAGSTLCSGACCPSGFQCLNNRCEKAGVSVCGPTGLVCPAGKTCLTSVQQAAALGTTAASMFAACCAPGQQLCGSQCCSVGAGQACVLMGAVQQCVVAGSTACGPGVVCVANQQCALKPAPKCCQVGETVCSGACCAVGKACVNNQCMLANVQACGAGVCPPATVCVTANVAAPLCCPAGDVGCGSVCCPAARCRDNRCGPAVLPPPPPPPVLPVAAARG